MDSARAVQDSTILILEGHTNIINASEEKFDVVVVVALVLLHHGYMYGSLWPRHGHSI